MTQKVSGLPPFQTGNEKPSLSDLHIGCEYQRIPDWPFVQLTAWAWRNDPADGNYPADVGKGKILARQAYDVSNPDALLADVGPAEDVQVGEKAKWRTTKERDSCFLMTLDQNVVLQLQYQSADEPNALSEACRGPLRELAKSFYDAVQPQ